MHSSPAAERSRGPWPYVAIARPDHWFKNAFMLAGVVVALFVEPATFTADRIPALLLAFVATCLVASSNYVLNELLDAPYDRLHPVKRARPAASGAVRARWAIAEWAALGAAGIGLGLLVNPAVAGAAVALWLMGIAYNVPPLRTKELPYLDVLSESVNNPIRLFLGWFPLIPDRIPPLSLVIAYWMSGAFFMAIKRFAEYRRIADPAVAASYRKSFSYYTEDRLLVSIFFYAMMAALLGGVFIVRYHLELLLGIPLVAGFFAYYVKLGLKPDSPVQNPERLHRERGFVVYAFASTLVFVLLMFTSIPGLYEIFNVKLSQTPPLWTLGTP